MIRTTGSHCDDTRAGQRWFDLLTSSLKQSTGLNSLVDTNCYMGSNADTLTHSQTYIYTHTHTLTH